WLSGSVVLHRDPGATRGAPIRSRRGDAGGQRHAPAGERRRAAWSSAQRSGVGSQFRAHGGHRTAATRTHCDPRIAAGRFTVGAGHRRKPADRRQHQVSCSMSSRSFFTTSFELPTLGQQELLPGITTTLCSCDRPLALFPVRLETRSFHQPFGGSELRVRVYPDKIHLDSHETELTPSEREWGEHYWTQVFQAGDNTEAHATAWSQLADRFGAPRAAWIVRITRPVNIADRTSVPKPSRRFPPVDLGNHADNGAWQ